VLRLRIRANIDGLHDDWETDLRGKVTAKLLVSGCRAPESMIQVRESENGEAVLLRKFLEQKRKRDGVRSA
jgi:hypothetical protein